MTDLDSIVTELLGILAQRGTVSLYWSEPGSHLAIWELDGRTRAYFGLLNPYDEIRRIAVESLAAELDLKCKKVRGTDGFDSLQLDFPADNARIAEVLRRILTDILRVEDWSGVRLSRSIDV